MPSSLTGLFNHANHTTTKPELDVSNPKELFHM
jgi:hypothetical protein